MTDLAPITTRPGLARRLTVVWRGIYNGVGGWAALVAAFLGVQVGIKAIAEATASIRNERARLAFARYAVDRAVEQGREIDAVALIRAINATTGRLDPR